MSLCFYVPSHFVTFCPNAMLFSLCDICSRHGFTYIRGWMQMVLAPNDLFSWNNNTMSTMLLRIFTHYISCRLCTLTLTLCIIASWSRDEVVVFASWHLVMSSRLPCPNSTDAHWPQLGAPVPPPPKWRPLPQGPRTLPFQGPEQHLVHMFVSVSQTEHKSANPWISVPCCPNLT